MALIKDYKILIEEISGEFQATATPRINEVANQNYRFSKNHWGLRRKGKVIKSKKCSSKKEAEQEIKRQIKSQN